MLNEKNFNAALKDALDKTVLIGSDAEAKIKAFKIVFNTYLNPTESSWMQETFTPYETFTGAMNTLVANIITSPATIEEKRRLLNLIHGVLVEWKGWEETATNLENKQALQTSLQALFEVWYGAYLSVLSQTLHNVVQKKPDSLNAMRPLAEHYHELTTRHQQVTDHPPNIQTLQQTELELWHTRYLEAIKNYVDAHYNEKESSLLGPGDFLGPLQKEYTTFYYPKIVGNEKFPRADNAFIKHVNVLVGKFIANPTIDLTTKIARFNTLISDLIKQGNDASSDAYKLALLGGYADLVETLVNEMEDDKNFNAELVKGRLETLYTLHATYLAKDPAVLPETVVNAMKERVNTMFTQIVLMMLKKNAMILRDVLTPSKQHPDYPGRLSLMGAPEFDTNINILENLQASQDEAHQQAFQQFLHQAYQAQNPEAALKTGGLLALVTWLNKARADVSATYGFEVKDASQQILYFNLWLSNKKVTLETLQGQEKLEALLALYDDVQHFKDLPEHFPRDAFNQYVAESLQATLTPMLNAMQGEGVVDAVKALNEVQAVLNRVGIGVNLGGGDINPLIVKHLDINFTAALSVARKGLVAYQNAEFEALSQLDATHIGSAYTNFQTEIHDKLRAIRGFLISFGSVTQSVDAVKDSGFNFEVAREKLVYKLLISDDDNSRTKLKNLLQENPELMTSSKPINEESYKNLAEILLDSKFMKRRLDQGILHPKVEVIVALLQLGKDTIEADLKKSPKKYSDTFHDRWDQFKNTGQYPPYQPSPASSPQHSSSDEFVTAASGPHESSGPIHGSAEEVSKLFGGSGSSTGSGFSQERRREPRQQINVNADDNWTIKAKEIKGAIEAANDLVSLEELVDELETKRVDGGDLHDVFERHSSKPSLAQHEWKGTPASHTWTQLMQLLQDKVVKVALESTNKALSNELQTFVNEVTHSGKRTLGKLGKAPKSKSFAGSRYSQFHALSQEKQGQKLRSTVAKLEKEYKDVDAKLTKSLGKK